MCNKADYFTRYVPDLVLSNEGRNFIAEYITIDIDVCADELNSVAPVFLSRENNFLLVPNSQIDPTKTVFLFPPGSNFYQNFQRNSRNRKNGTEISETSQKIEKLLQEFYGVVRLMQKLLRFLHVSINLLKTSYIAWKLQRLSYNKSN